MRRPTGTSVKGASQPIAVIDGDEQEGALSGGYEAFLENSPTEQALLRERLAEAEKGVFISSEAMLAWVSSWGTDKELPPPEPDIFPSPKRR